jgi:hypothetical protein
MSRKCASKIPRHIRHPLIRSAALLPSGDLQNDTPPGPLTFFAPRGASRIEQRGAEQAQREIDTITGEAAATLVRGPIDRVAAKLLNPAIDKIAGVTGDAYRRARDAASAKFLEKMVGLSPEEARAQVAATSEAALTNEPFAREALARVMEAKAASQFGSQVGGDFNRSFRGKGKFLAAQNADPVDGPAIFEFLDGRRKIDDETENDCARDRRHAISLSLRMKMKVRT